MAQPLDRFKATFREEAFELLTQLEDKLLELESQPLNGELINAAFRAIHTVKGSAAMFGFDAVSASPTKWRRSSISAGPASSP